MPQDDPTGTPTDAREGPLWYASAPHEAATAAIRKLIEANKEMRRTFESNERAMQRAVRSLERGNGVAGTFVKVPAGPARRAITEAEQALARARHQVRLAVFAAGLAEGMTVSQLSRCWGFSRQLGSRYAKEIRSRGARGD